MHLREVLLQALLGLHVLLDPVSEGVVDGVPLVHHRRRAFVEQNFDFVANIARSGALALGALDILVAELRPSVGHRISGNAGKRLVQHNSTPELTG